MILSFLPRVGGGVNSTVMSFRGTPGGGTHRGGGGEQVFLGWETRWCYGVLLLLLTFNLFLLL